MIYLIADTHYNHTEKMIKWCRRPADYEKKMFNSTCQLKETDQLIHLGDVCMKKDQFCHDTYIKPLKCKKILVLGNHDHKSVTWYYNNGWDFVCTTFSLKRGGKTIIFSHSPLDAFSEEINIHGHLHNTCDQYGIDMYVDSESHRVFAVEFNNYMAVKLDSFLTGSNKGLKEMFIVTEKGVPTDE